MDSTVSPMKRVIMLGCSHDPTIARSRMPLLVMLSVTSVTVAQAKSHCVVADLSGTSLNVSPMLAFTRL
jgi:hypothetical protein